MYICSRKFNGSDMTVNDKILSVIQAAINDEKKGADLFAVDEKFAQLCKNELNLDISGFSHYIYSDDVRHLIKRHGQGSKDRNSITNQDFLLIPIIQKEYDKIWVSKTKQGLDAITYVKEIIDEYYYVEEIRTGKKKLAVKELRKRNKKV